MKTAVKTAVNTEPEALKQELEAVTPSAVKTRGELRGQAVNHGRGLGYGWPRRER